MSARQRRGPDREAAAGIRLYRQLCGAVVLILEDGYTVTVPMAEYRREVLAFAEKIEDFYNAHPRTLPEDEWERENYLLFWKEWHRRKEQAQ